MAEQAFGIKEFNLIGSGTPTISSPNNLNLKAATVAISTNISIGGTMSVIGGGAFGIGSTVGIGSTLYVSHGDLYLRDNHQLNINNDALTMRGNNGGNSFLTNFIDTSNGSPGNFYISNYSGDVEIECSEHFSVKTNALAGGEQAILATQNGSLKLYHNDSGTGGVLALETTNTGVSISGTLAATAVTGDGSGLTNISVGLSTEQVTPSSNVATLDLTKDDHKIVASGTYTITCTGGTEAENHTLRIENSGTANVGFSSYFKFPSGGTPSLPTTNGAISLISFTVHKVGSVGIATVLLSGASVNYS